MAMAVKKWNWGKGLLGVGTVLVALAFSLLGTTAYADEGRNVVLPEGVTFENQDPKYTVYYEDKTPKPEGDKDYTGFYSSLDGALAAVYISDPGAETAVLYCKPGANVKANGVDTRVHVADNVTIYGNGAYMPASSEFSSIEIDYRAYKREESAFGFNQFWFWAADESRSDLTKDITLTVKSLDGVGLWGSRKTTYNINAVFEDCQNMYGILQHTNYKMDGGPNGTTDVTVKDSSFNANNGSYDKWSIQVTVGGAVNVENTTFTGVKTPIYMDNQAVEKSVVDLSDCTFVDCASSVTGGSSPIWLNGYEGSTTEAAMSGLTFEYSEGVTPGSDNAITIGDDEEPANTNISFTMSNTDAGIAVHEPGGTKEYDAKDTDIVTGDTTNTDEPVVVTCTHPAEGVKAVAAVEPTCTVDGSEAYWTCAACNKMYSDANLKNEIDAPAIIKAPGHKTELVGAKDATCTAEGYTGDEVCTVCGETVKKGETTAKLAHEFGEWKVVEEATADKVGSKERSCAVCGLVETAELPKLDGTGREPGDGATLAQTGDPLALAAAAAAALAAAGAVAAVGVRRKIQ